MFCLLREDFYLSKGSDILLLFGGVLSYFSEITMRGLTKRSECGMTQGVMKMVWSKELRTFPVRQEVENRVFVKKKKKNELDGKGENQRDY